MRTDSVPTGCRHYGESVNWGGVWGEEFEFLRPVYVDFIANEAYDRVLTMVGDVPCAGPVGPADARSFGASVGC